MQSENDEMRNDRKAEGIDVGDTLSKCSSQVTQWADLMKTGLWDWKREIAWPESWKVSYTKHAEEL
jgi:hypothetical protein